MSSCQSTFTPSLAHAISTSSGAGLRGLLTISAPHPNVFRTQSPPLLSPLCSRRPSADERGARTAPWRDPTAFRSPLVVHDLRAVDLGLEHQSFRVDERMALRLPLTCLAPS